MVVHDASYYAGVLESLYDAIEGQDTSGYRGADSDRWSQARHLDQQGRPTNHLEALVDLGAEAVYRPPHYVHAAELSYFHRYNPDDDSVSQARIHASARSVMATLLRWSLPGGERSRPIDYSLGMAGPSWAVVTVRFALQLPLLAPPTRT